MAITLNRRKPSWGDFSSGMLPKFMPLIAEQKRQQHDDDRGNGQHLHDLVDVAGIEADVAVDRRHGIAVRTWRPISANGRRVALKARFGTAGNENGLRLIASR